jgi:hypothetical protein
LLLLLLCCAEVAAASLVPLLLVLAALAKFPITELVLGLDGHSPSQTCTVS